MSWIGYGNPSAFIVWGGWRYALPTGPTEGGFHDAVVPISISMILDLFNSMVGPIGV